MRAERQSQRSPVHHQLYRRETGADSSERVSLQEALRIILGIEKGKEVAVEVDSEGRIVLAGNGMEDLSRALNRRRVSEGLNGPGSKLTMEKSRWR